jgi:hypothetical protein
MVFVLDNQAALRRCNREPLPDLVSAQSGTLLDYARGPDFKTILQAACPRPVVKHAGFVTLIAGGVESNAPIVLGAEVP